MGNQSYDDTFGNISRAIAWRGPPYNIIFGQSEGMQAVRSRLAKVASANVPVLITGEKRHGQRHHRALIHAPFALEDRTLCQSKLPGDPWHLLESDLFGYEKGAFTGAYGTKPGRVEMAHRGTLFLDEISELDALQSKLLQLCRMDSSAVLVRKKTRKSKSG